MKKVESLSMKYVGYKEPDNKDEVELEILGLETVIAAAQQRIAVLKQSLKITELVKNSSIGDQDEQTIVKTP